MRSQSVVMLVISGRLIVTDLITGGVPSTSIGRFICVVIIGVGVAVGVTGCIVGATVGTAVGTAVGCGVGGDILTHMIESPGFNV